MRVETVDFSQHAAASVAPVPRINGVPLNPSGQPVAGEELRQRACTELLRQAAIEAGLLDAADAAPGEGVFSEAASEAIDALLGRELQDRKSVV